MDREPPSPTSSAQPPAVAVIIVNWNGRHWLEQCLPTIEAQTFRDFETIVVDNGSTDRSTAWLAERWPTVRVLAQSQNLGFAKANNLAVRATGATYIVTLNNDTEVEPDWLKSLVAAAAAPGVGMVASRIELWGRPGILDSAGIEVDWTGIAWNRGWGRPASSFMESGAVFGPSAAAALYRRDMLEDVGLFDEDFVSYYEDVDLAWRAQRRGWQCVYVSSARVRHRHSATARRMPRLKAYLLGRNKIWTILKNFDWPDIIWALPFIIVYDFTAVIVQTAQSRSLKALHGRLSALMGMKRMLAKRKPGHRPVRLSPPVRPWQMLFGAVAAFMRPGEV